MNGVFTQSGKSEESFFAYTVTATLFQIFPKGLELHESSSATDDLGGAA
jgi:hypothetical protein